MAYIDYEYFKKIYTDDILDESAFARLLYKAERKIDLFTTGIDGYKKLREAFPTNVSDAEAVKRCVAEVLHLIFEIDNATANAMLGRGYKLRDDGSYQGNMVTSVSAGNESISYSGGGTSTSTVLESAIANAGIRDKLFADTMSEYLSGVPDANGVNLMFLGRYPKK